MARKETIATREYTYTVVFDPEPEGGFTATVPALPGCVTYGETLDEARAMAAEAIGVHIEGLRMAGEPVPPGEEHLSKPLREAVTVKLPAE
jgi:predicted RNase H-like HicB family nuclease